SQTSPGVLTIPSAIQTSVQNATQKTSALNTALIGASAFDLQTKRSVADFKMLYNVTPELDFNVTAKNTQRDGSQPMTLGFGFSGVPDELAAPLDTRTTEFGTSLQYGNNQAFAKFGYDGSFFRNNIGSLTWSNPFRVTDSATLGPASGRIAYYPNTNQNTVSLSAGLNQLPGRSHVTGFISYGMLSNNDPLIPFTINSAIPSPALPRSTADVNAHVTAMNFTFTSRPVTPLWFSARYRQYEYDNRTAPFTVVNSVSYDYSAAPGVNQTTELLSFTRHTFDADASYSPVTFFGVRAGYTREIVDRLDRWIDTTTEDLGRVSADLTGMKYVTLRGIYEYSQRRGAVNVTDILAAGEQTTLGQYDIANRNRNRATGIVVVTPLSALSFNASAGRIKDEYPNSYFGLRNSDNNVYSVGFDGVPIEDKVTFGVTYGYEKNTSLQASRYAPHVTSGPNPNFNDPNSDWTDNAADNARTANASIDILKIVPRTDLRVGYDYIRAESTYLYTVLSGKPIVNLTSATGAIGQALPSQLPAVTNQTDRGIVDVTYHLTSRVSVGLAYTYERYQVNDFALGPQANGLIPSSPTTATPSIMMLGYYWLPYTANTYWARLTYLW
ncbi:MAG TPA: MtrB/PioB family outer membrane beta-barrel protein, partial [Vicinamibacterales bacterium]|nr:MtrB/PioB family outer membrane beta-barrel protein [Vicinamibacterales bacterium]